MNRRRLSVLFLFFTGAGQLVVAGNICASQSSKISCAVAIVSAGAVLGMGPIIWKRHSGSGVLRPSNTRSVETVTSSEAEASFTQTKSSDDMYPKPIPSGFVRIYHHTDSKAIQSIKKHGLLTCRELVRRGLVTRVLKKGWVMNDQYDVLYFKWLKQAPSKEEQYVGFDVDPDTTYVHNQEYRADNNVSKYNESKVKLSDYIARRKTADRLEEYRPKHQVVVFRPLTAQPFYMDADYKSFYAAYGETYYYGPKQHPFTKSDVQYDQERHYLYPNEIIVPASSIPADQLVFVEQDAMRNSRQPDGREIK